MTEPAGSVLIVDDREANRYSVAHILKRAGFTVVEAATGKEALELAGRHPSIILLDVKLPDILGYEVCRRIKTNPHTSFIPVLQLSSAFLDNESKIYALESGADAYLTQPVDANVLIATVKALVRLNKAESQMRLSARQWQATFDALNEGVALTDPAGIVQRCNRKLSQLIGKPYLEIERRPLNDLLRDQFGLEIDPQNKLSLKEISARERYFEFSFDPVYLDYTHTNSIFIISETTARKRAEAAVLSNERLAATGRVANTIAHEINNPLEAITNLLYLMEKSFDGTEVIQGYLLSAQNELARVSKISRQILAFNRESAKPVRVNVGEILDDVFSLNNQAMVEKQLKTVKESDQEVFVEGFPGQLRQVFSNLLRNAIEASFPNATLRIRISCRTRHQPHAHRIARVTICDSGVGIPSKSVGRVFEAFYTTKDLKGSGIGLWLSSTIVQEHKGRIQLRSCVDPQKSGTCVSVLLPCEWRG